MIPKKCFCGRLLVSSCIGNLGWGYEGEADSVYCPVHKDKYLTPSCLGVCVVKGKYMCNLQGDAFETCKHDFVRLKCPYHMHFLFDSIPQEDEHGK